METIKRDVDELNELAEKMTGKNPKARTTSEALNYIEQNYNGGRSGNVIDIILPETFYQNYLLDPTKYGTSIEVTDENDIEFFNETFQRINNNKNGIFRIVYHNNIIQYVSSIMLDHNKIYVITIEGVGLIGDGYASLNLIADYSGTDTNYYVLTKVYSFSN